MMTRNIDLTIATFGRNSRGAYLDREKDYRIDRRFGLGGEPARSSVGLLRDGRGFLFRYPGGRRADGFGRSLYVLSV